MLKLLLGRAGAGKTARMLEELCRRGQERPQLWIVPEQYSHEAERALCAAAGDRASAFAEVLSFSRLANRVFAQAGGLAVPTLDAGGRLLLMHCAVQAVSGRLKVYGRPSRRAAFLENLLATADELKSYRVDPDRLLEAGEALPGEEGDRLADLGLILNTYDAMAAVRAADPRDLLTRLARKLAESGFLRGRDLWLDCFTDFTPQERQVLQVCLEQAEQVTAALTCAGLEGEDQVFAPARRTAHSLLALAARAGVRAETEVLAGRPQGRPEALERLEDGLFRQGAEPWDGPAPQVVLAQAPNPWAEVEWTAGRILELARTQGVRFREIGVAARTLDGYGDLLEAVFQRYGIPLFLSRMDDILQKPVLTLLTAALDAATGGYEYEDVFRYLKTGLAGVTAEERDKLENYVLRWDLRGRAWTAEPPWSLHPGGYSLPWTAEDTALVEELDRLRRRVAAPLERLRAVRAGTGRELALAVYALLEDIGLPERLTRRAEELRQAGELALAEEYRQLWGILTGALEQCADLLAEERMELSDFSQLFQLMLSQYSVGSIPVSLDRVAAGEAPRMAHKALRWLFVLGADDASFPLVGQSPGLLSDDDRAVLEGYGLELAPPADRRLDREMTILYDLCALPREGLAVSWARAGQDGEERRPCFAVGRIEALLPQCRRLRTEEEEALALNAPRPGLDWAGRRRCRPALAALAAAGGEAGALAGRMEEAARFRRGSLSRRAVEALYGGQVALSASRMDKVKSCHFAYFLQYGLKARPRKPAGFNAPEAGTFVHFVLEHVLRAVREEGGAAACPADRARELTRRAVEDYVAGELGGLEDKPPRFRYLFRRLLRSVDLVVDNVLEELRASRFQPVDFELGFGGRGELPPVQLEVDGLTLSISGFVDRVDGWEHDGRLYLRVVDYKTGRKTFDLTDIWNGMGLQMLLYLFTLEREGEALYNREIIPAGVLYLPARDAVVAGSRAMSEAERRRKVDAELRRRGIVLDEPEVLAAMEEPGEAGIRFLPVKVNKAGAITGEALVSAERLGKLARHTGRILEEIGRELAAGNIAADPFWRGPDHNACQWCEYAAACHFEEGRGGDRRRFLPAVRGEEFWQAVAKEQV